MCDVNEKALVRIDGVGCVLKNLAKVCQEILLRVSKSQGRANR